ncbi:MAG: hypothetical protein K6F32_01490 [Bacilli bacterium]|nr:hypothetical protein [Bacilli bacterium]
MKRSHLIISLIAITVVGSLFMLLASNMLFFDILNASAGGLSSSIFVSLPAISVAMFFVVALFYLLRTYKRPDCKKRITRAYSITLFALALLGIIGDILAGANFYHTFVGSHPFPGFLIIFLILNVLLLAGSVFAFLKARKMPEDEGKTKIGFGYIMKTVGWFLFICLLLNRLGTFLGSPSFIYWRNFYLTFPFYLFLLVPAFLGVLECCHILGLLPEEKIVLLAFVGLGIDVALTVYTIAMGVSDTVFVSSLSQAMPLERMLSKPIELPIHFLAYAGVSVAILLQKKRKKN